MEQKIFAVGEDRFKDEIFSMKDQVMDAIEAIEKLYQQHGGITGLATGFKDFDRLTSGLHPAEMIVIAARPSMGKTALAMNIAEHVAVNEGRPVAVFSLEMSAQQLVQRLLCSRAGVNSQKVRDGTFLAERDFPKLTAAASKLAEAKIFIDDSPGLNILELRAKARRLKAQHDIELIVIDYLQLLRSTSRRGQDNRQIEISEISAGIKGLAKELNIPIIVAAQLNRNPENRTGDSKGRPRLSDLRESGSIEQDADVVGLLVRQEYYADTEEEKDETRRQSRPHHRQAAQRPDRRHSAHLPQRIHPLRRPGARGTRTALASPVNVGGAFVPRWANCSAHRYPSGHKGPSHIGGSRSQSERAASSSFTRDCQSAAALPRSARGRRITDHDER